MFAIEELDLFTLWEIMNIMKVEPAQKKCLQELLCTH